MGPKFFSRIFKRGRHRLCKTPARALSNNITDQTPLLDLRPNLMENFQTFRRAVMAGGATNKVFEQEIINRSKIEDSVISDAALYAIQIMKRRWLEMEDEILKKGDLFIIDYIEDFELVEKANVLGNYFLNKLRMIDTKLIREVRGLGLFIGIEFKKRVFEYMKKLIRYGILSNPAGSTVLRFMPPLVIEKHELDEVVEKLEKVLKDEG